MDRNGSTSGSRHHSAIGPETVLQLKTLPTKKERTNASLTVPKTQLNETIRVRYDPNGSAIQPESN